MREGCVGQGTLLSVLWKSVQGNQGKQQVKIGEVGVSRFSFGCEPCRSTRESLTLRLWLRFAALWFGVVIIGLTISFFVLPYGYYIYCERYFSPLRYSDRRAEVVAVRNLQSTRVENVFSQDSQINKRKIG